MNATSRRRHDGVRRAPERIRSGRAGARFGWGGAGTLPRVAEGEVREDRPDDRGIVQRGDQAQPAQMPRAGQEDAGERMAPDPYLALPRSWLHQARRRGE